MAFSLRFVIAGLDPAIHGAWMQAQAQYGCRGQALGMATKSSHAPPFPLKPAINLRQESPALERTRCCALDYSLNVGAYARIDLAVRIENEQIIHRNGRVAQWQSTQLIGGRSTAGVGLQS
jgi:hypothetical protein